MATKSIAWNTGTGNITLTYQGQGDGPVSIQSDANNLGSARSQVITVETVGGAVTRNFTVRQAACPVPVGTVLNYAYTGSYQEVTLPAGQYKLQCWGAQGGSNAADSSYGITAQAGGKGGYSEGVITLSSPTTVRVYVGGAGTSSKGGFNGGGSTTGSASYNSGNEQGVSRMGGGGGATDIRLSDGNLLSRMIVAGGGSGGAMCYQKKTTSTTTWESFTSGNSDGPRTSGSTIYNVFTVKGAKVGDKYRFKCTKKTSGTSDKFVYFIQNSSYQNLSNGSWSYGSWVTVTIPSNFYLISIQASNGTGSTSTPPDTFSCTVEHQTTSSSTTTTNSSQVGYAGGGTTGAGYSSTYQGKQNAAGSGGAFGQGANQTTTNYRYSSGAGGGGWYGGGGGQRSDSSMTYCRYSGGGSGWVNIAANASYRPSGYTGLELDSGETKAGNVSFPSTSGGTETGHSGNGYARITRLA